MNLKTAVVFERRTGRIVASLRTYSLERYYQNPEYDVLLGQEADILTQRVDLSTKTIVDLPPRPSENHEFDYVAKVWKHNAQQAAWKVRAERDRRIAATDWTQLPDIPEAVRSKWQDYRQALRDVTLQPGFPEQIDWPVPPR